MAHTFSLENTFGRGQQLKSNLASAAQNREFNSLRASGERQRQDIQQRTFDADQQRSNTEKLLNGIRIAKQNPNMLPQVGEELVRSGILDQNELQGILQRAQSDPSALTQGLTDLENELMIALGQAAPGREDRKILTGADKLNRFVDTGEQVFEGVEAPPKGAGGGITGSLQELNAINETRAARGQDPLDTETFLTGRRENTAALQEFRQFKRDNPESQQTFAEFTAEQAGRVAGATETGKLTAQIAAIPAKVEAQYKADFKAGATKRIRAANDAITRIDSVMEEAQLGIDDLGLTTTGLLGSINRKIAGTTAFALARKIDTIQANLSFDRIAEMRKNSPTGGALGQVSERELSLLGAAVVALDQANNEDEVRRAFTKVLFHYNNWKSVLTGQNDADELLIEGDVPDDAPTATGPSGEKLILINGQWVPDGG